MAARRVGAIDKNSSSVVVARQGLQPALPAWSIITGAKSQSPSAVYAEPPSHETAARARLSAEGASLALIVPRHIHGQLICGLYDLAIASGLISLCGFKGSSKL